MANGDINGNGNGGGIGIPQVRGIFANMAVIMAVSVAGAVAFASLESWQDFQHAAFHGLSLGAAAAFGWLALKSPWAKKSQELLGTKTTETATVTKTVEAVVVKAPDSGGDK
jgi:hypothetical protein